MQILREKKIITKSRWEARRDYKKFKSDAFVYLLAFLGALIFLHPVIAFGVLGLFLERLSEFYGEYFANPDKKRAYQKMLAPRMGAGAFIRIGYEIDPGDLDKHLYMLNLLDAQDERAKKYLRAMDYRSRNGEAYRQIGLSKNQLTTHFWILGTTGAGKTSLIMQIAKMLSEIGGGMIFVDGKADVKMFFKLYNLAKAAGREQDVYLINFLPVEDFREHTNTFNPLANMSGPEIVEFFSSLKGQPSGDQAYWFGRGKSLLSPIANYLYYRKKYNSENFTIPVLYSYISDLEKFFFLVGSTYLMAKDMEERIKKATHLHGLFEKAKAKKGAVHEEFPMIDAFDYYFSLYIQERYLLKSIGLSYERLSLLWNIYNEATSYLKQLSSSIWNSVSTLIEEYRERYGVNNCLDLPYEEFWGKWQEVRKAKSGEIKLEGPQVMTALQQHSYAQQQWTEIFSTLLRYSNVFGSLEPEVDMLDIIKNQKFLYVLLPPLKQSDTTTALLGKLVLTAIRKAVSVALGEGVEGLTDFQREVLKKRITPVPLGVVVLDEYGAYPIAGIDTLLAQVRSINISMILSTQDYTSARVEGKDENAVRRAWGNTQKIILRIKDEETIKMLEQLIMEKEVLQESYIMVEDYYTHARSEVSVGRKKLFDPRILQGFKNGAGILMTDEDVVIFQSYWADAEEAKEVYLNHSFFYH